ncbi:hypothetical protein EIP91_008814 [Steccherinum ochraceum]|uniref:Uncharacterized protein n=1 Tax=Steccherinum ochraceum TaxID=92696 RepID=A0A4R0RAH6_9APHY|nr:hypothetical protein EIP91_008814 [Steccherinum ochraceum]
MSKVHETSYTGYDGDKSEIYDQARHRFDPAQLDFIRNKLTKKENLNVVEMGAGTGLFSKALLADPK